MPKNSLFQNTNPNRLHPGPIFPHSVLTSFALLKAGSQRHWATRSHMSCRSSTAFSHTAPSAWLKVCKWTQFSCWKSVSGFKLNPTNQKKKLHFSASKFVKRLSPFRRSCDPPQQEVCRLVALRQHHAGRRGDLGGILRGAEVAPGEPRASAFPSSAVFGHTLGPIALTKWTQLVGTLISRYVQLAPLFWLLNTTE